MVGDEAQLGVQRDVLAEVPRRVVRLGAEHGSDLVHALEHADHDLLVELRALGEVGGPPEVVEGEDVGAALGGRRDDLRGLDLGERERVEGRAEARRSRPPPPGTPRAAAGGAARRARGRAGVGSCSFSAGRHSSSGGAWAGAASTRSSGSWSSAPPGAWLLATMSPVTASTVSGSRSAISPAWAAPVTTTCARPLRSRTIRKVTWLSRRARWSQPITVARSPTCSPSSLTRTRCTGHLRMVVCRPPGADGRRPRGATALRSAARSLWARSRGPAGGA